MSGRPRNARAAAGRDHGNESDIQQDYLNRVIESIKKAQEHNEDTKRSGDAIIQLEEEIKRAGRGYLPAEINSSTDKQQIPHQNNTGDSTHSTESI